MNRKNRSLSVLLLVLLITVSIFTGCGERENNKKLINTIFEYNPYIGILEENMPEYEYFKSVGNTYPYLEKGGIIECHDIQAVTAIQKNVGKYWYPHILTTPVIAVDREQTNEIIRGWKDLEYIKSGVSINSELSEEEIIFASVAYGFDGRNFELDNSFEMFKNIYSQGRLERHNWNAPVMICMDYKAVNLAESGRNIEIIIPEEGTYTYAKGVISNELLEVDDMDDLFMDKGMRILDGRTENRFYPDSSEYERAILPDDFNYIIEHTKNCGAIFKRTVLNSRKFATANLREHMIAATILVILTLLWIPSVMHRMIRYELKMSAMTNGILIIFWILVRDLKYIRYSEGPLGRFSWYCYYIAQIGLALNLLYFASALDHPETNGKPAKYIKVLFAMYIAAVALVLTNDFHQFVFGFNPTGNWDGSYTYKAGYYIVIVFNLVMLLVAVIMLIVKSRKSSKKGGWLIPLSFFGFVVLYIIGYVKGVPIARESDSTITICFFSIMFFEGIMRSGIIPTNKKYKRLFAMSPLNLQLLDEHGETVYSANSARSLSSLITVQLQANPGAAIKVDEDTILYANKIKSGMAVWQEDISEINRLHREIETSVNRLHAANKLLSSERSLREPRIVAETRNELFDLLEKEIAEKTKQLQKLIYGLPEAENRIQYIAYITLLLCNIKRRCNLFFLIHSGTVMTGEELTVYLRELSDFSKYADIKSLIQCSVTGKIDIKEAILCYEFFFRVLTWAIGVKNVTLLCQLEETDNKLSFRILSDERIKDIVFSDTFVSAAEAENGRISGRELEEMADVCLDFMKGGDSVG